MMKAALGAVDRSSRSQSTTVTLPHFPVVSARLTETVDTGGKIAKRHPINFATTRSFLRGPFNWIHSVNIEQESPLGVMVVVIVVSATQSAPYSVDGQYVPK